MFLAALIAFAPLVFLALSVHAQGTTYAIVNPVTGLVFEDHDWVPLQVGNPITGSPYTELPDQLWEVTQAPDRAVYLRRDRIVDSERQIIYVGADSLAPDATVLAQNSDGADMLLLEYPFDTANGIFAFIPSFSSELAITAPSVANGELTLQAYNATNYYQHWVFVAPGTPQLSPPEGSKVEDSPKL